MRELKSWDERVIYTADADVETIKQLVEKAYVAETPLIRADLRGANLRGAGLRGADLSDADLRGANLIRADLSDANLIRANLSDANLRGADLSDADLSDADLRGADLSDETMLPAFWIIPEEGAYTAWKSVRQAGGVREVIAKLLIPAEARRTSSLVGRKCRAEFAQVVAFYYPGEKEPIADIECYSTHDRDFIYRLGETVRPDGFNDDIRVECTNGLHHFITRKEAEGY